MSDEKKISFFERNGVRMSYVICFVVVYSIGYGLGSAGTSSTELVQIEREKLDVLKGISKKLPSSTSTKSGMKPAAIPAPPRNVLRESPQSSPTRMRSSEPVRPSIETIPGGVPVGGGKIFPMDPSQPRYYNPGPIPAQPVAIPPGVPVSSFEVIKPRPDVLLAQAMQPPKDCGCSKKKVE